MLNSAAGGILGRLASPTLTHYPVTGVLYEMMGKTEITPGIWLPNSDLVKESYSINAIYWSSVHP